MFQRIVTILGVLSLTLCAAGPALASVAPNPYTGTQWYVTDLGIPSGDTSAIATGINSNGQVVGCYGNGVTTGTSLSEILSNMSNGGTFLWSAGTQTTLPTTINVSGTDVPLSASQGYGISSNGTIVGSVGYNTGGGPTAVAAAYTGGQWQSLGVAGTANWISADGQTVLGSSGSAFQFTGATNGVGGTLNGSFASPGGAFAMNSSGVIAGGDANFSVEGTGSGGKAPWYYDGGTHNIADGVLGTSYSGTLCCIDDSGLAAGVAGGSGGPVVFMWNTPDGASALTQMSGPSGLIADGNPGSDPYLDAPGGFGITSGGDIVGAMAFGQSAGRRSVEQEEYFDGSAVGTSAAAAQYAFLYSANGGSGMAANKVYDLNNLIPSTDGWVLESAKAVAVVGNVPDGNSVNHTGEEWIVGYGIYNNQVQAFLLTPTPYTPVSTPEPSTLLLLAGGLAGLAAYAWRKRR